MQAEKTVDSCFIIPIQQHKIGNSRDLWDDASEKYRGEMDSKLKDIGIRRMLVFLQTIPDKGDFMVFFLQSADSLDKTLSEMFAAGTECSKNLSDRFKDITGIDMSKKENIPKVEKIADWREKHEYIEERGTFAKMPWCYAVPVKSGKSEAMMEYIRNTMRSKSSEIEKVLREHDIMRRITFLQHTSMGDFIVQHILTTHPLDDLLMSMSSCDSKLCSEARKAVGEYIDFDFTDQKNVPNVELLFKWDEKHGFETADQIIAYTE
jgi:hypothetical protein